MGNDQTCIVTGPNIDIATKLIMHLKGIFETKLRFNFEEKVTILQFTVVQPRKKTPFDFRSNSKDIEIETVLFANVY